MHYIGITSKNELAAGRIMKANGYGKMITFDTTPQGRELAAKVSRPGSVIVYIGEASPTTLEKFYYDRAEIEVVILNYE